MSKLLPIKTYADKILRQKAKSISQEELQSNEIKQFILDMQKTMLEKDGVGLAAPQVGRSIRLAIINTEDGPLVLVNPKILKKSLKKEVMEEGCLSLPDIFGMVKRSVKIKVCALNLEGKKNKFNASGFFARVVQHELDHLDGVLFTDRAKEITRGQEYLEKLTL